MKPEDCEYKTLKEKLDSQYGVKKLVLAERHRFYNYKQREGQTLTDYLAELRKLAALCDWTQAQLSENLRDKFVMGIHNEQLLQQLLTQDHKKPLEELFELARTFEVAEKESLRRAEDNSAINSSTVTAAVTGSRPTKRTVTNKKQSGSAGQCASCGGSHLRSTYMQIQECHVS